MLRYVPDFILNKCSHDEHSGSFEAFLLFLDVADFTGISNQLRREGKRGAEALNLYLGEALSYPIEQVELRGGFISHFAGDAFCAVFPGTDARCIKQAVEAIRKQYGKNRTCKTEIGEYPIKLRMTVSCGTLTWNIYRNVIQNEYVLSGEPMIEIKRLSKRKADLALSESANKAFAEAEPKLKLKPHAKVKVAEEIEKSFVSKHLWGFKPDNEIRDAAYCFVNLSRLPKKQIEPALALMHEKLDNYGGYLNKLDDSDKGLLALLLFGLPKGMGNTLERACRFALELVAELPKVSLGLACGNAYAGYVGNPDTGEFTALGSALNLASRLMQQAGEGQIVTDSYLEQEMHYKYRFETAEVITPKGFVTAVHCHILVDRLPAPPQSFLADLVGREAELQQIRQAVSDAGSRILYISGEPGIGKSRLILEALRQYPKRYFLFCDPSGHRLLEPIKQFLRQHFAYDPLLSTELNQRNFRDRWQVLAGEDKELRRIESFLGNLLGFDWEGSIWNMLPPEEKPEQQRKAFATFMARIAETEQIIIHLDDPQWLDGTDAEYFRQLGTDKIERVVIVAACRYLEDGSSVNLEIPNWEARYMELGRLSKAAAAALIRHLLKVDALPEATQSWIVNKADGNPLFIEQVVAYLRENDCFDDTMNLKGNLDYLSSFGIADIIGSRIDSLTEMVRNTLQHACVLGLEFNTRVLSEMLSRKLDDDLGEGKQARVWADVDELRYIFTHVLIKDTAYNRMLSDKLKKLHLLAAETMERLYKDDEQALNEHAEEIAGHYESAGEEEKSAEYFDIAGVWYTNEYDYIKGEAIFVKALGMRQKLLGKDHIDTATSLEHLGYLYGKIDRYEKAEQLNLQSLNIRESVFGTDHPDIANSMGNLACLYRRMGEYGKAEILYKKALNIKILAWGMEHQETATSMHNLALLYHDLGKYDMAKTLYLKALNIIEKCIGKNNPNYADTLDCLAVLYKKQGKYDQAEPLFCQALQIRECTLGMDHPDTACSLNNIALLYGIQGKHDEEETMLIRANQILSKVMGEWHTDTAVTLNNLACFYDSKGRYNEALSIQQKALDIFSKQYGPNSPDTLVAMCNIAVTYGKKGDHAQSESILVNLVETMKEVLGEEHPKTISTLGSLASVYYLRGEYKLAESITSRVLQFNERVLGFDHPITARSLHNLANSQARQGLYESAVSNNLRAFLIRKKVLGMDHLVTAETMSCLACIYRDMALYDKAERLYNKVYVVRKNVLGVEHFNTQKTIKDLIVTYEKLKQPEKALEYRAMLTTQTEG